MLFVHAEKQFIQKLITIFYKKKNTLFCEQTQSNRYQAPHVILPYDFRSMFKVFVNHFKFLEIGFQTLVFKHQSTELEYLRDTIEQGLQNKLYILLPTKYP